MNNKTINWLIFVVLCFIWGSSFIMMKLSKDGLSASQIAALRIFSAGVVLLPFAIYALTKFPRKKLVYTLLAGLLRNLLSAFLFPKTISKNIDNSLGRILNSLTPICVVISGVVFF